MAKYDPKLLEEELKNKVAADWFAAHFMSDFLKDAVNRTASEGTGVRRGAGRAPYGLQDDAQQRGRDILVACNKAASTIFSRDRNVASPLIPPSLGPSLMPGAQIFARGH